MKWKKPIYRDAVIFLVGMFTGDMLLALIIYLDWILN